MINVTICLSCANVYKDGVFVKSEKEVAKLWLLTFRKPKPDMEIVIHTCNECSRSIQKDYLEKVTEKYREKTLEQTSP